MNAQKIYGKNVYVNLDEVIETVYQCRADVADREWEKRWLEPLMRLEKKEVSEDAISREWAINKQKELIKLYKPHKTVEGRGQVFWQIEERKLVAKELEQAPSVAPKRSCYRCGLREDCEDSTERKPKEGEWIPCSERTPTKEGHYLCSLKKPNRIDNTYIGLEYWTGDRWHGHSLDSINAWKPLPKPWKGADDE